VDFCLLTCNERGNFDDEEDTNSPGKKKKDANKVEEIEPPLKNCRKRRFRKILRKK
jgi:TATA-binding protein-associated factor Taf7